MNEDIKQILEIVTTINQQSATKDDLADLDSKTAGRMGSVSMRIESLEKELRGLRNDIAEIDEKLENQDGLTTEIDHLNKKVVVLERKIANFA